MTLKIQTSDEFILFISAKGSLLLDSQHPSSLEKIRMLETPQGPVPERADAPKMRPRFLTPLNSCNDLVEGQPAHFEATIEPTNDNTVRIEWYHNNQPLQASSRTTMYHDFGLVTLDLRYSVAEDAGVYTCRAVNSMGDAVTQGELQCRGRTARTFSY